jgi:hypothetical protein
MSFGRRGQLRGPFYIYLVMLEALGDWAVIYVGQTNSPSVRLDCHLSRRRCHSLLLEHFIEQARTYGWRVHMQIVEVCERRVDAFDRERWWINDRLLHGDPVANKENPRRFSILEDTF